MLTGYVPFVADSSAEVMRMHLREQVPPPSRLRPDVPEDLDLLVLRATAKDPDDRFGSAAEVVRYLDGAGLTDVDPSRLRRRTITVLYDEANESKFEGLFKKWAKQAGKVKGTVVRTEEDPPR